MSGLSPALTSSRKHDWTTPRPFFAELHAEFRFTLDACAHDRNACLPRYFSPEDDALKQSWAGERVWMNPPFGSEIHRFVHKAHDEAYSDAELVVCLLPARTDTRWWHAYVMRSAEVRFIRGRLMFGGDHAAQSHNAPFPCAVVVMQRPRTTPVFTSMSRFRGATPLLGGTT